MKSFRSSVWENKTLLFISFIPYIIIVFIAIYYGGIVGFRFMESWNEGFGGFIVALELIGLVLVATPVGIPIWICLFFQIGCLIHTIRKKRKMEHGVGV